MTVDTLPSASRRCDRATTTSSRAKAKARPEAACANPTPIDSTAGRATRPATPSAVVPRASRSTSRADMPNLSRHPLHPLSSPSMHLDLLDQATARRGSCWRDRTHLRRIKQLQNVEEGHRLQLPLSIDTHPSRRRLQAITATRRKEQNRLRRSARSRGEEGRRLIPLFPRTDTFLNRAMLQIRKASTRLLHRVGAEDCRRRLLVQRDTRRNRRRLRRPYQAPASSR